VPDLDVLERRIKWTAIQSFILAACCFALTGVVLVAAVVTAVKQGVGAAGFMALMSAGGFAASAALVYNGWVMLPPRSTLLYRVVESEPERLGWVYARVGKVNGVKIHLLDGSEHALDANGKDSAALIRLVQERAPHAIAGWCPAQKQAYVDLVKAARRARG